MSRAFPTPSTRGVPLALVDEEAARLQAWRWQQLDEAGFTYEQVTLLLNADVDYRAAVYLVERGCRHETAVDILV